MVTELHLLYTLWSQGSPESLERLALSHKVTTVAGDRLEAVLTD